MRKNTPQKEVRERTVGYIVAALSLIAGLAWNDAVKGLIEFVFPLKENTLSAKFIYAGTITIAVVALTVYLNKLFTDDNA